jgi:hypothetical protein
MGCGKYIGDLTNGNKTWQKCENGVTMIAECEEHEDFLVIEDEKCYGIVLFVVM